MHFSFSESASGEARLSLCGVMSVALVVVYIHAFELRERGSGLTSKRTEAFEGVLHDLKFVFCSYFLLTTILPGRTYHFFI